MLTVQLNNGTERKVNVRDVKFEPMGVTFLNSDLKCSECLTYDKIKNVRYELEVTEEMVATSKQLQFNASDARPRRTMNGLQT